MAKKESSEAAKKIANAEKEKTSKKKSNKPNVFVRMGKAIKSFLKNSKGDLKKITWPGGKDVLKGVVVTIVCIAILGLLVFLVDLGLTSGIKGIRSAAENRTAVTTTVAEAETTAQDSSASIDVGTTTADVTTTTTAQ